jgi:hypothetical protein
VIELRLQRYGDAQSDVAKVMRINATLDASVK